MNEDHDDFAFEPVPGLPARLPKGEAMLWQGSPDWRALALSAFHVRAVALYFGIIAAWQWLSGWRAGQSAAEISTSIVLLGMGAILAAAILAALAWLYARGTIYTLTTKRIVIRSGVALPVTLNLPLALLDAAAVRRERFHTGSIAMTVAKPNRVAWLVLWPNTRPWNVTNPQPMLRCLADIDVVAPLLAKTLTADAGASRALVPATAAGAPHGQPALATMAA